MVFTTSHTALPDFDVGSMETSAIGYVAAARAVIRSGDQSSLEAADAAVAGVLTVDELGQTDIGRGRQTYCQCCRQRWPPPGGTGGFAVETGKALLLTFTVDTKMRAPDGMLLKVAFRRVPKSARPATALPLVAPVNTKLDSEL